LRVHCCQLIFSPLPDILLHYGSIGDGAMRHCYMLDVPWEMVPWDTVICWMFILPEFMPSFLWGSFCSIFCAVFWRSLFILYLFAIVLLSFWLPYSTKIEVCMSSICLRILVFYPGCAGNDRSPHNHRR
jgi:hypothetical protein